MDIVLNVVQASGCVFSRMVTPALRARFAGLGVGLISPSQGARLFAAELRPEAAGVEVVLTGAGQPPGLASVEGPRVSSMDVLVDPQSYQFLDSHCVEGEVPVLPAVLVLEWFVRAARLACPERVPACCRDLKVLGGAPLPQFEQGRRFRVVCRESRAGAGVHLETELLGANGTRHYSAVVELAEALRVPGLAPSPLEEGRDWPWTVAEAYAEHLFHGPDFQVLRALRRLSRQGGEAMLWGTEAMGWAGGPWLTNPAALDGGLHLALLWALQHSGRKSLPTRIGAFIPYRLPLPTESVSCELRVRQMGRHELVGDLLVLDRQGRPVAELQELTMTLLANKEKVPA
jgi:hypothetical protein